MRSGDYIKISKNQYTDKAVDVTVVIEEIVTQIQNNAQRFGERDSTRGFELDLRYSERASWRLVKDTGNESSLRKAHGRERYASPGRG